MKLSYSGTSIHPFAAVIKDQFLEVAELSTLMWLVSDGRQSIQPALFFSYI